MQKKVKYKGEEYTIEIKWVGNNYFIKCLEVKGSFTFIPIDCLNDIEKIKPYIVAAIEYKSDLVQIEEWDGNLWK